MCDVSTLPPDKIRLVEADSYWCMSKLLDGIQVCFFFFLFYFLLFFSPFFSPPLFSPPFFSPPLLSTLIHVQDHYTFAQPGLQRMVHKLKELIGRIDGTLSPLFLPTLTLFSSLSFSLAFSLSFSLNIHVLFLAPLARHLGEQDAQFIQFAFRWMNCLLMREIPLPLISRMWDTYLAEGPTHGFGVFHVVCKGEERGRRERGREGREGRGEGGT